MGGFAYQIAPNLWSVPCPACHGGGSKATASTVIGELCGVCHGGGQLHAYVPFRAREHQTGQP